MTKAKVSIRKASVRKDPSITNRKDDVIGTLNKDEVIAIDENSSVFDWTGKEFYKCSAPFGDGYILKEIVEVM